MRISRRLGIILAILLFVGFAGFFDVYDYLRFNFLIKRMDSLEKIEGEDMAYKVTGTCLPSDFKRIVAWLMHHGNFRIDSLSVQNSVKTAVSVPSMMTVPRISIDMIVVGVMGR